MRYTYEKLKQLFDAHIKGRKNVVGFSGKLQRKIKDGIPQRRWALRVYVSRKESLDALDARDVIPPALSGLETDVVEVGEMVALEPEEVDPKQFFRPAPAGASAIYAGGTACVPPDTLIRINPSLQPIEEIAEGAILEDNSRVARTFTRRYRGRMIEIDPYYVWPIRFTPEHPIKVWRPKIPGYKWRRNKKLWDWEASWIEASNIRTGCHGHRLEIKKPSPGKLDINPRFAEFLGYFVSEGSTSKKGGNYRFRIGVKNRDLAERILKITEYVVQQLEPKLFQRPLGYKIGRREVNLAKDKNGIWTVRVYSKDWYNWLRDYFGVGAKNKRIPDFMFDWSNQSIDAFFDGYLAGDGWKYRKGFAFNTTSELLSKQLWMLLLKRGILASWMTRKVRKRKLRRRMLPKTTEFRVYYDWEAGRRYWDETPEAYIIPIKAVKILEFDGVVHNLETTSQIYQLPFTVHNCTIGWLAEDNTDGELVIIANNHCTCDGGKLKKGHHYVQPSPYDGRPIRLGELKRCVPIHFSKYSCGLRNFLLRTLNPFSRETYNEVDLGIVSVDPGDVKREILNIGPVEGKRRAAEGEKMMKMGRTTGLTRDGKLLDNDYYGQVRYSRGIAQFGPCGLISKSGFSAGGDSSSAILCQSDRFFAGLLFAGSESHTIYCHFDLIEKHGDVTIVW